MNELNFVVGVVDVDASEGMAGEKIKNFSGIATHQNLPSGYRVARPDDFHLNGRRKVGMVFIIHGYHEELYEEYKVNERLTEAKLQPWLGDGRVFVKN